VRIMTSSSGIPPDPRPTVNRLTLSVAQQLWEKALALAPDDAYSDLRLTSSAMMFRLGISR
jgi:hypothetical protein